jgi:hypothetical protein
MTTTETAASVLPETAHVPATELRVVAVSDAAIRELVTKHFPDSTLT